MEEINNGLAQQFKALEQGGVAVEVPPAPPVTKTPETAFVKSVLAGVRRLARREQTPTIKEILSGGLSLTLEAIERKPAAEQEKAYKRLVHGFTFPATILGLEKPTELLALVSKLAKEPDDVVRRSFFKGSQVFVLRLPEEYQAFSPWIRFGDIRRIGKQTFVKRNKTGTFENGCVYWTAPRLPAPPTDVVTFVIHQKYGLTHWCPGEDPERDKSLYFPTNDAEIHHLDRWVKCGTDLRKRETPAPAAPNTAANENHPQS